MDKYFDHSKEADETRKQKLATCFNANQCMEDQKDCEMDYPPDCDVCSWYNKKFVK